VWSFRVLGESFDCSKGRQKDPGRVSVVAGTFCEGIGRGGVRDLPDKADSRENGRRIGTVSSA